MVAKKRKPGTRLRNTALSPKERKKIDDRINNRHQRFRNRYPEVHGKVVDFISHAIEDGTLCFTIRFKDRTNFSLRYRCDMHFVGADFCDVKAGSLEVIREY